VTSPMRALHRSSTSMSSSGRRLKASNYDPWRRIVLSGGGPRTANIRFAPPIGHTSRDGLPWLAPRKFGARLFRPR
jgi:hypothetical protein